MFLILNQNLDYLKMQMLYSQNMALIYLSKPLFLFLVVISTSLSLSLPLSLFSFCISSSLSLPLSLSLSFSFSLSLSISRFPFFTFQRLRFNFLFLRPFFRFSCFSLLFAVSIAVFFIVLADLFAFFP